jgi:hypothetical protein
MMVRPVQLVGTQPRQIRKEAAVSDRRMCHGQLGRS